MGGKQKPKGLGSSQKKGAKVSPPIMWSLAEARAQKEIDQQEAIKKEAREGFTLRRLGYFVYYKDGEGLGLSIPFTATTNTKRGQFWKSLALAYQFSESGGETIYNHYQNLKRLISDKGIIGTGTEEKTKNLVEDLFFLKKHLKGADLESLMSHINELGNTLDQHSKLG